MSEQINKVLASTSQAFTTAEQVQARQNIDAQKSIAYSYSGNTITAIDNSAVGLNSVYANNCISGDGTSGSPLGISSRIQLNGDTASAEYSPSGVEMSATPYTSTHYRVGGWNIYSTGNATHHRSVGANCSGIEINWDTNYYVMRLSASGIETKDAWYPSRYCAWYNYNGAQQSAYDGKTSVWNDHELTFKHSASGAARKVDIDSIDRWNSYSSNTGAGWNESGNSLSTGFGGNQVTAASQYNVGAGNWAARSVKMSGLPDQTLYGFQTRPPEGSGSYQINAAGAFVAPDLPTFNLKVYKPTDANLYLSTSDYPAMPSTADGLLILVNLGSGPNVVYPDSDGATAFLSPHYSAELIWDSNAHSWVRWNN